MNPPNLTALERSVLAIVREARRSLTPIQIIRQLKMSGHSRLTAADLAAAIKRLVAVGYIVHDGRDRKRLKARGRG